MVEGWLLRHTPEVAHRRSNSVLPLSRDAAQRPSGERARLHRLVEAFYARLRCPALYQVGPLRAQRVLDGFLDDRGYTIEAPTAVLIAPVDLQMTIAPKPVVARIDEWAEIRDRIDADAIMRRILKQIHPPTAYALARLEGHPVGVGLAAAEQGWAGIFSMATRARARRRGVTRGVLHTLATGAAIHGAPSGSRYR